MSLLSLSRWSAQDRAGVRGVLTDIDDTLTTEGAITPDALGALQRLRAAGLPVFAITGRPAGWSEAFALSWPVNAIVAENGAVALWQDTDGLQVEYAQDWLTGPLEATGQKQAAWRTDPARSGAGGATGCAKAVINCSRWARGRCCRRGSCCCTSGSRC